MQLGNKKASEALEEHLMHLVPTEPDAVWLYLRPAKAKPKGFVKKLRDWADQVNWDEEDDRKAPRRPGVRRVLLELRTNYLNHLDAFDSMLEAHSKFPHNIYSKKQIAKAAAVARATADLHMDENTRLLMHMVHSLPFKKSAGETKYKIGGFPPEIAMKALVYWCLRQEDE